MVSSTLRQVLNVCPRTEGVRSRWEDARGREDTERPHLRGLPRNETRSQSQLREIEAFVRDKLNHYHTKQKPSNYLPSHFRTHEAKTSKTRKVLTGLLLHSEPYPSSSLLSIDWCSSYRALPANIQLPRKRIRRANLGPSLFGPRRAPNAATLCLCDNAARHCSSY